MSSLIHYYGINELGRDFIVGDIHGMFDALRELMELVKFDRSHDRLFSVGDLIDRGPKSHEAYEWCLQEWFHPVRGNHENKIVLWANDLGHLDSCDPWFQQAGNKKLQIADIFRDLPVAIEIQCKHGSAGIVHAECPIDDWTDFACWLGDGSEFREAFAITNDAIYSRRRADTRNCSIVKNIDMVFVGHCRVRDAVFLGNHCYLDTGACRGGALTLVELGERLTFYGVSTAAMEFAT